MSLNKIMLIGNLGHDPEIRYMPESKRAVTNLSVAMNDSFTDRSGNRRERTDWLTVVAFGKLAELCHQHLKTGRQIYVVGSIRVREYEPTEGAGSAG
jgi:single-strand DNA-binding protein